MRPAVLTAVLLLVDILNTGTVVHGASLLCKGYSAPSCGGGWHRIAPNLCVKYGNSPKSFRDAKKYCRSLKGDLMSIHSHEEMRHMICVSGVSKTGLQTLWIGARRSKVSRGGYRYTDGSKVTTILTRTGSFRHRRKHSCIAMKVKDVEKWISVPCSQKKTFMCVKNM